MKGIGRERAKKRREQRETEHIAIHRKDVEFTFDVELGRAPPAACR